MGHTFERRNNPRLNFGPVHGNQKRSGPGIRLRPAYGLHGQMQHDRLAFPAGQMGHISGMGLKRQHRPGQGHLDFGKTLSQWKADAEIVNDDGHSRLRSGGFGDGLGFCPWRRFVRDRFGPGLVLPD